MPAAAAPPWKSFGAERLREAFATRPEALLLAASAGAWLLLIATHLRETPWRLCIAGRSEGAAAILTDAGVVADRLVMLIAMMLPLVGLQVHHVVIRSYASRQLRGAVAFLAGYLVPWLVVALAMIPIAAGATPLCAALAFAAAALWQLTPAKRRALRRCARTAPLRQDGWRADRACIVYGAEAARACMATCWAPMLAVAMRPHDLAAMALVQLVATAERTTKPRPRLAALALASAGTAFLWT